MAGLRGIGARTPAEVRAAIAGGERILAWTPMRGAPPGAYLAATDAALYVVGGPVHGVVRLPWDLVTKATWTDEAVLVVEGRPGRDESEEVWHLAPEDLQRLPTVVYERVTSNVVVSERVALEGELGVRIVARRSGDDMRWTVTFDPGLDPQDPDLRRRAEEALADLRSTLGL